MSKDILVYMLKSNFTTLFSRVFSTGTKDYFNLLNNDDIVEYKNNAQLKENDLDSFKKDIIHSIFQSSILGIVLFLIISPLPVLFLLKILWALVVTILSFTLWFKLDLNIKNLKKQPVKNLSINLYDISSYNYLNLKHLNKKTNNLYDKNYFLYLNTHFDYETILLQLMYLGKYLKMNLNVILPMGNRKNQIEKMLLQLQDISVFKSSLLQDRYNRNFKEMSNSLKEKQMEKLQKKKIKFSDAILPYQSIEVWNYPKLYLSFIVLKDEMGLSIFKKHQLLLDIILNFLELQSTNRKKDFTTDEQQLIQDIESEISIFTAELENYLNTSYDIKNYSNHSIENDKENEAEYNSKLDILKLAMNSIKK